MLLISTIAVMFIPIMYAGFFLGSVWDPYGNTSQLPVAFVNNDQGANLNGSHINIGNDIEKKLKTNNGLDWNFVSSKVAATGFDKGNYYMIVTIPSDFSEDAATVMNATPKQSTIDYKLASSKNYIGSMISEQGVKTLKTSVTSQIGKVYVSSIFDEIRNMSDKLDLASSSSEKITSASGQLYDGSLSLMNGLIAYKNGISTVNSGQSNLNEAIKSSASGSAALYSGISQLDNALPNQATSNFLSSLGKDPTKISSDLATINAILGANGQSPIDTRAITTLCDNDSTGTCKGVATEIAIKGAASSFVSLYNVRQKIEDSGLLSGSAKLSSGLSSIANGSSQLVSGTNNLYSSTDKLITGSKELSSNLKLLESGSSLLSTSLAKASSQLKMQQVTDKNIDHIVDSTEISKTTNGNVPGYGYALAPYVLSLGLFVGAITFTVIYPIRRHYAEIKNGFVWWLTKFIVSAMEAICQALIMDLIMEKCLGLVPAHQLDFILISCTTSLTFMSIVVCLSIIFDNPGRFIALLLLVLQLGGSGGTFPLQLSNEFFRAINPYMPMTYSILGFRQSISSGLGYNVYSSSMITLFLIGLVAQLILLIFFTFRHKRGFVRADA